MRNFCLSFILITSLPFVIGCGESNSLGSESSEISNVESGTIVASNPLPADPVANNPSGSSSGTTSSTSTSSSTSGRVWTVSEILSEPRKGGSGGEAKCGGEGGFKRCVCAEDVPANIRYRPAVKECNGHAAIILSGEYEDSFSVVVRDTQNRDRWPVSGFNGCSASLAGSESPPKSCSAFKAQDEFSIGAGSRIFCLGASGYSRLFEDVVRITIKLEDVPNESTDPLERHCLAGNEKPLN